MSTGAKRVIYTESTDGQEQKPSQESQELNRRIQEYCHEFWEILKMSATPKKEIPALLSLAIEEFGTQLVVLMFIPLMDAKPASMTSICLFENWLKPIREMGITLTL